MLFYCAILPGWNASSILSNWQLLDILHQPVAILLFLQSPPEYSKQSKGIVLHTLLIIYIYIYTHIYTHTHIYIYIHTYIFTHLTLTHIYACMLCLFSRVRPFATLWTVAHQAPLSMRFSRQEYWSGLSCPFPGDLPRDGTCISYALTGRFFTISSTWKVL